MSTASDPASANLLQNPPAEVRVDCWPLRDDWPRAWLVIAGTVAFAAIAGETAGSTALGVASMAALNVALWRLWMPVRFELGHQGVVQSVLGRRRRTAWKDVDHCRIGTAGILLLPHQDTSPLACLRGLYIPYRQQREELLDLVDYYLSPPPSASESTRTYHVKPK